VIVQRRRRFFHSLIDDALGVSPDFALIDALSAARLPTKWKTNETKFRRKLPHFMFWKCAFNAKDASKELGSPSTAVCQ
jgi:hypothetical protein